MKGPVVILGYGPVGEATAEILAERGTPMVIAQRHTPAELPEHASFVPCDVLDAASVRAAVGGASQVVLTVGLPYIGTVWREAWPRVMIHVTEACVAAGARLVFFDNLYMYGPQTAPLREDMPLTDLGLKPAARSAATRIWQKAASQTPIAALRAPDFYGPGVGTSHLGEAVFKALAQGRPVPLIAPPDTPHDFAYVPDLGAHVVQLLDAPDDAFGRAWHAPSAPTRTPRQILTIAAEAAGVKLRLQSLPLWLLPMAGVFSPMLREFTEMRFQWDRPYHVDSSAWTTRFGKDVTPFEVGVIKTLAALREGD